MLQYEEVNARELQEAGEEAGVNLLQLAPRELLDLWLQYNGIIGYTDKILDFFRCHFDDDNLMAGCDEEG